MHFPSNFVSCSSLQDLEASRTAHDELQLREAHLTEELATTKGCLEKCEEHLKERQSELLLASSQISLKDQEVELLRDAVNKTQKDLKETRDELTASVSEVAQSERCIQLLREKLDSQDSKLWGVEEALNKAQKKTVVKDAEVQGAQDELTTLKQRLVVCACV